MARRYSLKPSEDIYKDAIHEYELKLPYSRPSERHIWKKQRLEKTISGNSLVSPPSHALSYPGASSMVDKQCIWLSALPFEDTLPAHQYKRTCLVFKETSTQMRHIKSASSFILIPSTILFNVPYVTHAFRIWFLKSKQLMFVVRNSSLSVFLSGYRNWSWFTDLCFMSVILECALNLTFCMLFQIICAKHSC